MTAATATAASTAAGVAAAGVVRCQRCDRVLTSAASIARGRMGAHCRRLSRRAAEVIDLSEFRDAATARDKAEQLIVDGAMTPGSRPGVWLAASSRGEDIYVVDVAEGTCTCKAHQRHGRCSHRVAARMLSYRPARMLRAVA